MDTFGRMIAKDRREITSFCNTHSKIYIYGAGSTGRLMSAYLDEQDLRYEGFIVTNEQEADTNKGIYWIEEINIEGESGFIIACANKHHDSILKTLFAKGVSINDLFFQKIYGTDPYPAYDEPVYQKANNGYYSEYIELDRIGEETGTDKGSSHHDYLNKYEHFLSRFKDKDIRILELGIYEGASLKMWEKYFTKSEIISVDINENCKKYQSERCRVIIGDLGNEKFLQELSQNDFDLVVDDASHFWSHQIKAFIHIFPSIKPGSVYIMEDLGTSFKRYTGCIYADASISAYDFCKTISEVVVGGEHLREEFCNPVLWELRDYIERLSKSIESVTFLHGSCIFIKK